MNWGKGIFLTFVIFASGLVVMLVITLREDLGLVAKDYYKQEIAYHDQMERIRNYMALAEKPVLERQVNLNRVVLSFPTDMVKEVTEGEVLFFRPSSSNADVTYKLMFDEEGNQYFDLSNLEKGMWRIKLNWKDNNKEYYQETVMVIE